MKKYSIILIFISSLLISCAHKIVAFDKNAKTVTIQKDEMASEKDMQKLADTHCGGNATLLKMEQKAAGTKSKVKNSYDKDSSVGVGESEIIYKDLYTYSCK